MVMPSLPNRREGIFLDLKTERALREGINAQNSRGGQKRSLIIGYQRPKQQRKPKKVVDNRVSTPKTDAEAKKGR
ncbi:hypothetical protein A8F94_19570 [Bacillus sp. FJAT-27225]|nr:hypothetical protein A8F94_19570 [Bacillus sp. FJAT-27225]